MKQIVKNAPERCRELRTAGYRRKDIAATLGLRITTVGYYLRRTSAHKSETRTRVQQCVDMIYQGLANKEIAARLDLSEGTVKGYLRLGGIYGRSEAMAARIRELEQQIADLRGMAAGAD